MAFFGVLDLYGTCPVDCVAVIFSNFFKKKKIKKKKLEKNKEKKYRKPIEKKCDRSAVTSGT